MIERHSSAILLAIFIIATCVDTSDSFSFQHKCDNVCTNRLGRNLSGQLSISKVTYLNANAKAQEETSTDENGSEEGWTLEEDWTLQDQVQLFTVQSSTSTSNSYSANFNFQSPCVSVTFWTQLKHCTPILSRRTEKELKNRYMSLYEQQQQVNDKGDDNDTVSEDTKSTTKKKLVQCGSSPEILTNWWMEAHSSGNGGTMMMSGVLMNDRQIWFPLHHAGKLHGSADFSILGTNNHVGEDYTHEDYFNYAEAIGGSIYELGLPRRRTSLLSSSEREDLPSILPWLSSRNGSIFSIAMASILSAAIAFSSDPLHQQNTINSPAQSPAPLVIYVNKQKSQSSLQPTMSNSLLGGSLPASSSSKGANDVNELSIGAQRARMELRVDRDKRTLSRTQERLKNDEIKLKELQREESLQGESRKM